MKKVKMNIPDQGDYQLKEGLNQLKTNVAFCGEGIKVISITSSVMNEGKSSVAFSLAKTLAADGKKTLLLDADLRKSTLVAKYHIEGIEKGFSHYLTGQAGKEDIIYATEYDDFYLTVAGPLVPDPIRLLNSDLFGTFMEQIKEKFDYVIVDTPPLGLVVDAVIIGQHTDGPIVVIEQGVIKRKILQDVVKQLRTGNVQILGAVLNKVDQVSGGYYKYSYYSEGYSHGKHKKKQK